MVGFKHKLQTSATQGHAHFRQAMPSLRMKNISQKEAMSLEKK